MYQTHLWVYGKDYKVSIWDKYLNFSDTFFTGARSCDKYVNPQIMHRLSNDLIYIFQLFPFV